jgi:hypothetical protein
MYQYYLSRHDATYVIEHDTNQRNGTDNTSIDRDSGQTPIAVLCCRYGVSSDTMVNVYVRTVLGVRTFGWEDVVWLGGWLVLVRGTRDILVTVCILTDRGYRRLLVYFDMDIKTIETFPVRATRGTAFACKGKLRCLYAGS